MCVRACVRVCACVRWWCVRARARACVRACVRALVCACAPVGPPPGEKFALTGFTCSPSLVFVGSAWLPAAFRSGLLGFGTISRLLLRFAPFCSPPLPYGGGAGGLRAGSYIRAFAPHASRIFEKNRGPKSGFRGSHRTEHIRTIRMVVKSSKSDQT